MSGAESFKKYWIARTSLNDGKEVVITAEGEENLEDVICERGVGEGVGRLGVGEDVGIEIGVEGEGVEEGVGEGVEEGEGVVKDKSEVVKVESNEAGETEEDWSSEDMEEKVERSGTLVGVDKSAREVEESIVMEESKGGNSLLELRSVGRVTGEEMSVEVDGNGSESSDVDVGVSNVPVLDGGTSVTVGSSVCVGVGCELTSKEVEGEGVEKSVGVSLEKVEKVRWWDLVKNGGVRVLVNLKEEEVSSDSVSSSLMEGVDKPQYHGVRATETMGAARLSK